MTKITESTLDHRVRPTTSSRSIEQRVRRHGNVVFARSYMAVRPLADCVNRQPGLLKGTGLDWSAQLARFRGTSLPTITVYMTSSVGPSVENLREMQQRADYDNWLACDDP